MRKTIKLAVVAALALGATSAFATNGDNMIGTGAKARAMGGVGVATSFGAESSIANPALLSSVKNKEFSASITAFMPDVSAKGWWNGGAGSEGTLTSSDADFSLIPEFAYATRANKNLVYGFSVTGTAGMGTDYEDDTTNAAGLAYMKTELQLMKIAVPVSYQMGALSLGVAPVLQYGTLNINNAAVSNPKGSDLTLGYEVGAAYDVTSDLTLGAVYKSKLHMQYEGVLSASIAGFMANQGATGVYSGDNLDQPAEYGVGISYVMGGSTIAVDYKRIEWGSANGYKDFGWEDQDVYSVGYEYATKTWALRAGYNYAKSPIKEQAGADVANVPGTAAYNAAVKNFFNLAGFPGIVESHYTVGAGYNMSDDLSIDCAVVYAAEEKVTFDSQSFGGPTDVVHSQLGVTVGASYKF